MSQTDFLFGKNWTATPGNQVDFQFQDQQCKNLWGAHTSNAIPITFDTTKIVYQGNQVPITFECQNQGGSQWSDFAGFIEFYDGGVLSSDIVTTLLFTFESGEEVVIDDIYLPPREFDSLVIESGEETNLSLETDITFNDVEFGDGAYWDGAGKVCHASHTFVNVGTSENNGTLTSTGFRLKNPGGASSGSLVARSKFDVSSVDEITFSWTQTLSGSWFDNDETDASHYFGMFLDREHTNITSQNVTWNYDTPFDGYEVGTNLPWLQYWLPRDTAAKTISARGRLADGTPSTTGSFSKPAGLDLYGGSLIQVRLVKESGKIRREFYVNGDLLHSALTTNDWPTSVVPLWYYRNYQRSSSYIDIANVEVCSGRDFLEVVESEDFYIPSEFYEGAEATFDLSTTRFLSADFAEGALLTSELDTRLGEQLLTTFFDGAETATTLSTTVAFAFDSSSGAGLSSILDTRPGTPLSVSVYDGAGANASLTTEVALQIEGGLGELLTTVLDVRPNIQFTPSFVDGAEVASIPLWAQASMQPRAYAGAEATFDITTAPSFGLPVSIYDGPSATFNLSLAIQLGTVASYDGASASISLDTLENFRFYDGAETTADLSTSTTLSGTASSGETLSVNLSVFLSEGIGNLRVYDGASASIGVDALKQVLLYPNTIKDPGSFNWDILGHMGVDLNNEACCPIKDGHDKIELSAGPAPDEYFHGDKVVFQADLSTLPRFSVSFAEGVYFEGVEVEDRVEYLSMAFRDGTGGILSSIDFDEYNFNLCRGNFLPDGDHVNVELVTTDLGDCESTVIFDGAEVSLDIEANPQFQILQRGGEYLSAVLTIVPGWGMNFYGGEHLYMASNPEFNIHFRDGPFAIFTFAELPIRGYDGATMIIDKLSTDYDVEFLERGCLDNEFVPMNENGDADWEKFNPVPVELDFFSHSIKARCL